MNRPRHRVSEFWTDPSSGQFSMSRLALGVVVLVFFPANIVLEACGVQTNAWAPLVTLAGTLAGVYGLNSAAGAWKRNGKMDSEPPPPDLGGAGGGPVQ